MQQRAAAAPDGRQLHCQACQLSPLSWGMVPSKPMKHPQLEVASEVPRGLLQGASARLLEFLMDLKCRF